MTTSPDAGYAGRFATVLIEDALIGPGKVEGTPWDPGTAAAIPASVVADLATALGASNPFAAAIGVLGGPALTQAISAGQKPDVYGTMRLDGFGQIGTEFWLAERDRRTEDSFTPAFPGPVGYQHVPIDADLRLRILFADADLLDDDDPIGIAVLNSENFRAALASRTKYQVPVSDQTNKQLLFIGISVLEE